MLIYLLFKPAVNWPSSFLSLQWKMTHLPLVIHCFLTYFHSHVEVNGTRKMNYYINFLCLSLNLLSKVFLMHFLLLHALLFWLVIFIYLPWPLYADYHRLRVGGLILAAVLCLIGITILLSKMQIIRTHTHTLIRTYIVINRLRQR